ncbi:MAG: hypothetical protein WC718_02365 [Phycisphaerales bacterium]|jgi:hypothetical protein
MSKVAEVRCILFAALAALAATPVARGQILSPLPEAVDFRKPTREWPGMLRVRSEKVWQATVSLKAALYAPRKDDCRADPAAIVNGATFVLPWVPTSATQESNQTSVDLRGWIGASPMPGRQLWIMSPDGMQRLRGLTVQAPGTSQFDFQQTRKDSADLLLLDPPNAAEKNEGLYAQLELKFLATSRDVELNEELANSATWPSVWPPEAQSTFQKQIFLDLAVDPWSRQLHDIDQKVMASVAREVLEWGGETDPKHLKPAVLAKGVAAAVLPGLFPSGDGMVPMTDFNGRNLRTTDSTGTSAGLPVIYNTTLGVDVRDVVSVLRDRYTNPAERALVLAAIYRKLGLPARVMVGFEAERDNDSQVVRRLGQIREKKIPDNLDEVKKKLAESDAERAKKFKPLKQVNSPMWPDLPPMQWVKFKTTMPPVPMHSSGGGGGGGGGAMTSMPPVPQQRNPKDLFKELSKPAEVSSKPLFILPSELAAYSNRKRMRFWVEFALYDPERGLAWVPVDPGSGGNDWHFGSLDGAERIVVLGTGFWPAGLEMVDRLGDPARTLRHLKRDWSGYSGNVYDRPDGLPAAFWGFFTQPSQARVFWQEFGFDATRASTRSSP